MRREPPPVKTSHRGGPSNLPPQHSQHLVFELSHHTGTKGQKASACISHDSCMSDLPWLYFPCSPSGDHSSCRHTQSGEEKALLKYLCCTAASWNRHRGYCIISWFFYAQNTSSALTSSQLIYLISTELIYFESPGLYHRYNQVHVYKISCGTQCLKWNIQWIQRAYQWIVLMGDESAHWKHLFIQFCFAYFIM